MQQHFLSSRRISWGTIIVTGMLLALLMTGCQTDEPENTAVSNLSADTAMVDETAVAAPEEIVAQATITATVETDAPELEAMVVSECLNCHVDKDMLIRTADPEEEVISENEGEG